jgi:hypothetical protein
MRVATARGDPPRLRVTDEAFLAASSRQADLGQLRRLARACLAADDDHLMLADRARDLLGTLRDAESAGYEMAGLPPRASRISRSSVRRRRQGAPIPTRRALRARGRYAGRGANHVLGPVPGADLGKGIGADQK